VIVQVENFTPFATAEPLQAIPELATETDWVVNSTVVDFTESCAGDVYATVFSPTTVDFTRHVISPLLSVVAPLQFETVTLAPPKAALTPAIATLPPSFTLTVQVV
jgi:hypothetical protein